MIFAEMADSQYTTADFHHDHFWQPECDSMIA